MTDNTNPGNFANRPKEEVKEIASKGGQSSHNSGFASVDPDKQVRNIIKHRASVADTWPCSAKLLPRAVKPPVVRLSQVARERGRQEERVEALPEPFFLVQERRG